MATTHDDKTVVIDSDSIFTLNANTRTVTSSPDKLEIVQFDHNSERLTFECDRYIEGHDVLLCNAININYIVSDVCGVYEIEDLAVSENDEYKVTFSWLISSNVSQRIGNVQFVIKLMCVQEDGSLTYAWNSKINSSITVVKGINNSDTVAYKNTDVLEQWKNNLMNYPIIKDGNWWIWDGENYVNTGNSSSLAPTDEQVNAWLDANGVQAGATTEQAAQIDRNVANIGQLSNVIYAKITSIDAEYIIGGIGSSGTANNNAARVRINNFVFAKAGSKISVDDGYKFNVALYSRADSGAMTAYRTFATDPYVLDADAYFRASIATTDDAVQSDTNIGAHFVFDIITGSIVDDINNCTERLVAAENAIVENESRLTTFSEPDGVTFVLGGIGTGGTTNDNAARVRTLDFIPAPAGAIVSVDDPAAYKFNIAEYSDADVNACTAYRTFGTAEYTVQADGYIRASIAAMDDATQADTSISRHLKLKTVKKSVFERIDDLEGKSDFRKSIRFGVCALQQYYRTGNSDYSLFTKNTTSADYYAAFSELAGGYSEYCTITNLGNGSDGNPLYLYDFKPISFKTVAELTDIPKIIIISGQHGFEKCSCYGLYYFVRDLLTNWQNNPTLDYIRNHVHLMILPCVNRYGFDNLAYKNANGVNLNRNYPVGFTAGTAGTDDYGGGAAFDQPETQIVRNLVSGNTDAMLLVDFHTNGSTNVADWTKCNWHSFSPGVLKDNYYKNLYYASGYHITNITAHFISDYGLTTDGHQCGSVSTDTNADAATAKAWAESLGIMSLTFEGFNGFPSESVEYSENTQRANAELIGNYIASVLSVFAQIAN